MKAYGGMEIKIPHILNIRITTRQLVVFEPRSLYFRVRIVGEGVKSVWVLYEESCARLYQGSNQGLAPSNESFLSYEAVRCVVG
jgi:hypothetical protein